MPMQLTFYSDVRALGGLLVSAVLGGQIPGRAIVEVAVGQLNVLDDEYRVLDVVGIALQADVCSVDLLVVTCSTHQTWAAY